jgi:hypothetical protein
MTLEEVIDELGLDEHQHDVAKLVYDYIADGYHEGKHMGKYEAAKRCAEIAEMDYSKTAAEARGWIAATIRKEFE